MDNLTHTLVGAALAEAGLKRRTALGAATLMIGANFPDIDVIAVPLGASFEWRRGITHGIPAHFVLPFVLAGLVLLWDRHVRRRRDPGAPPADFRQLVLLSAVAILTHPALDFMNTYGVRWLMPFVDKWFYADGLFIVDPWIMIALAVGIFWSRRAAVTRPAGIALAAVATYIGAMLIVTGIGRNAVASQHPGKRLLVAPAPIVPWRREVVVEEAGTYRFGSYTPFQGVSIGPGTAIGDDDPAVALAKGARKAQVFLQWARFPYYRVTRDGSSTVVRILDARYAGQDWASVEIRLP